MGSVTRRNKKKVANFSVAPYDKRMREREMGLGPASTALYVCVLPVCALVNLQHEKFKIHNRQVFKNCLLYFFAPD